MKKLPNRFANWIDYSPSNKKFAKSSDHESDDFLDVEDLLISPPLGNNRFLMSGQELENEDDSRNELTVEEISNCELPVNMNMPPLTSPNFFLSKIRKVDISCIPTKHLPVAPRLELARPDMVQTRESNSDTFPSINISEKAIDVFQGGVNEDYNAMKAGDNDDDEEEGLEKEIDGEEEEFDCQPDEDYCCQIKPSRRKGTKYADHGDVPSNLCSAPYKYLLKITHPVSDSLSETDFEAFLTAFDPVSHVEKGQLAGGLELEYLRSKVISIKTKESEESNEEEEEEEENSEDLQVHFYHIQFTLTSFLNHNEKYRLNVAIQSDDEDAPTNLILQSPEFLLVARKNKKMDDLFWNNYAIPVVESYPKRKSTKKRKKSKPVITRKKSKPFKYPITTRRTKKIVKRKKVNKTIGRKRKRGEIGVSKNIGEFNSLFQDITPQNEEFKENQPPTKKRKIE